jgi:hypothetical protein
MIDKWRQDLLSDPQGRVWWNNLQYDLAQSNLSPEISDQFLEEVARILGGGGNETPIKILFNALREPPSSFSMQGKRVPGVEPFSRVVDARSFALYNVRTEEFFGVGASDEQKEKVWEMFQQGDIEAERHYKGELRTERNFFWGTLTKRLEEVFAEHDITEARFIEPTDKGDALATQIRNLLGLSYMGEGIGIYRIDIPLDLLESEDVQIRAPTTLDSSPSCVFLPADATTNYGWTINLEKMETGVEEVVIKTMGFTKELRVMQIGFIRGPLPEDGLVWQTLERLVEGRIT